MKLRIFICVSFTIIIGITEVLSQDQVILKDNSTYEGIVTLVNSTHLFLIKQNSNDTIRIAS
jgi:hypothetical protein